MNAEFNWWLLIVGLVAGAGLVWLVIADWSRREEDVAEDERAVESAWIAQSLRERGTDLDPDAAEQVLALHRDYLRETGALEAEIPPDWDESWRESAWPDGAAQAADSADEAAEAAAERTAPIAGDGVGPKVADAVPPPNNRSVRATPLSPRGTATGAEPDNGPEQLQP